MIDTHAHLNFKAFEQDLSEVVERCFENGMKAIINVGAKLDTSQRAVGLARQFDNLYAAVGLHPIHVNPIRNSRVKNAISNISKNSSEIHNNLDKTKISNGASDEEFDIENYRELVSDEKVVAIGETGLDYFHIQDPETRGRPRKVASLLRGRQKEIFQQFLKLAVEKDLPLILHCRGSKEEPEEAYREMLNTLNTLDTLEKLKGVIHCFTSTPEIAQQFLDLGFYVGFTGVITFAKELEETVKAVPLDKILLETDCPFMSPEPFRGKRCEPWYVKFVAEKIAGIKSVSFEEVVRQTTENAVELFRLT